MERPPTLPTQSVETPLILPPVFNKMNSREVYVVWKKALDVLRQAKNIIIVGYSLPKTDTYMQYFLKSAVGPNSDLQKIIVFNLTLFEEYEGPVALTTFDKSSTTAAEMKNRYLECFSKQFSDRIVFQPTKQGFADGTLLHFSNFLAQQPKELLFYP